MRTIVLHIGTTKTGTTALQKTFANQVDFLRKNGISYPNLTGSGFGWTVERGLSSGNADTDIKFEWNTDDFFHRVQWLVTKALVEEKSNDVILLSSENLSRLAKFSRFWETLQDSQKNKDVNFKVVAYVRNPFQMFMSCYQQYVKLNGFTGTLGDFIDTFWSGDAAVTFTFPRNILTIQKFAEQNDIELQVYRYEDALPKVESHFFREVLNVQHLELPEDSTRVNRSWTVSELNFQRGVNSVAPNLGKLLGFERDDLLLSTLHEKTDDTRVKFFMTEQDQSRLNDLFVLYKEIASEAFDFSGEIDYSINSNLLASQVETYEEEFAEQLFQLGRFVGSSYKFGYIKWAVENSLYRD